METPSSDSDWIRRAVIQQLQGFRRAGLTHWNRILPAETASPSATQSQVAAAHPPTGSVIERPSHRPPSATESPALPPLAKPFPANTLQSKSGESESIELARKKTAASPPSLPPRGPFQPLNLPLADRISGLAALQQRVKNCTRCSELAATRTQTVFGVGNPAAKIVFIGEAPGADEDAKGEPFVGRAGQLLNDIIKACRLSREEIYICNVLRCRPPGNRLPAPEEAANCREYLDGQLAHVNPEYIVCWGACAAQNLLDSTEAIGKLRKRFFHYGNSKVICTYHPSYLLRNPAAKKDVWDDMKMLFLDMGIDLMAKTR